MCGSRTQQSLLLAGWQGKARVKETRNQPATEKIGSWKLGAAAAAAAAAKGTSGTGTWDRKAKAGTARDIVHQGSGRHTDRWPGLVEM